MPLSRYLKIYPDRERPGSYLLYSTRKGSLVRVPAALLSAMRDDTLSAADRETLTRMAFMVSDPAAERREMMAAIATADQLRTSFKGIVVLNLECNLDCVYCFEGGFRGKKRMNPETARLLVERVSREYIDRGRDVAIDFYGGEPLLTLPLLKEIAQPLRDAAKEQGTKFSFDLFTNGTLLTRPLVEELIPLGLKGALITLDGPREIHDRQRPFVSGKGSFDTIVANLLAVWDLLRIQVNGNYTRDNWREFPKLIDYLLSVGITPEKLENLTFTPVNPKAGKEASPDMAGVCHSSSEPWMMESVPTLRKELLNRGFPVVKPAMSACMVEFENNLLVNFDGTLYKCPAFMGYPELSIGTLADGVQDYAVSHNLALWQNDECLDCAYLPLCFGGCRFLTLQRTGVINEVDCRRLFLDACLEEFIRQDLELRPQVQ